jgi:hypothetical protein
LEAKVDNISIPKPLVKRKWMEWIANMENSYIRTVKVAWKMPSAAYNISYSEKDQPN